MGASCLDRELGNVVSVGSHAERRKGDRVPPQSPRSRQGDVGQGLLQGAPQRGLRWGGGAELLPGRGRASPELQGQSLPSQNPGLVESQGVLGMKGVKRFGCSRCPFAQCPFHIWEALVPSLAPRGHRDDRTPSTWGPLQLMISFIAS